MRHVRQRFDRARCRPLRARDERGQAATEFIIIFFILCLFATATAQLALVFAARSAVNYASFCSARTAITWYREEKVEDKTGQEFALDMAHRAAALACVSVAEPGGSALSKLMEAMGLLAQGAENLQRDFAGYALPTELADRYVASYAATEVSFVDEGDDKVPVGSPLTVQVVHWFRLRVPMANRIMGFKVWALPDTDGNLHMVCIDMAKIRYYTKAFGIDLPPEVDFAEEFALPGYYLPITASCTLDVE